MIIDKIGNRKGLLSGTVVIIIVVSSYFPIFNNLGSFQIRMWDEATYANNSIDMMHTNRNIFVVERHGKPDSYITKPPLVIWLQALSMKLFGINEFAVRLPSAIFGLLTILLVYFFCSYVLESKIIGFIAAGILMTSKGYIGYHVVRTGDLDATLVSWLMLGFFTFIDLAIKKPKNSIYHFIIITVCLTLGFLTKGIASFFFVPIMFIISLINNNHKIYRDKYLYISAFVTIMLCLSYYLIREISAPGYLKQMWADQILRYTDTQSYLVHPFNYYYQNLKTSRFNPFFYVLALILILPFILKSKKLLVSIYLSIGAIGYFLFISNSAVKLQWYDAPLFPILSVLIGIAFVKTGIFIFRILNIKWDLFIIKMMLAASAVLLLIKPYKEILVSENLTYPEEEIYRLEFDGAYLKYLKNNVPEIKNLTVFKKEVHEVHYDQVLFYIRAYEHENNYHIKLNQDMNFQNDEIVMACKQADKDSIENKYLTKEINIWRSGTLYQIIKKL